MTEKIALLRKFGLHASADALEAVQRTCRTCEHLDVDTQHEPCVGCHGFERWRDAGGVTGTPAPKTDADYDLIGESGLMRPDDVTEVHTDHPLRHCDRSCPACNAGVDLPDGGQQK